MFEEIYCSHVQKVSRIVNKKQLSIVNYSPDILTLITLTCVAIFPLYNNSSFSQARYETLNSRKIELFSRNMVQRH